MTKVLRVECIELVPEDYNSKSSFLDNEFPQQRTKYEGKHSTRGVFTSANRHKVNADVNATYNILVKSDLRAIPKRMVNGVEGYVMYPRRVCVDPQGMKHRSSTKYAQPCLAIIQAS